MRSLVLSSILLICSPTFSQEWTEFRGPTGQGTTDFVGLPLTWGPSKNVIWKADLEGNGWSSPVVFNGRIYLTAAVPIGDETVESEGAFKKETKNGYSLRTV